MTELENPPATRAPIAAGRKRRLPWIGGAILAVMVAADWTRSPAEQISVRVYNKGVVGGYRQLVRPVTHSITRCRFQPTCSRYSEEAMRAHGFPKGLWLTVARLFRCLPWVPRGTYDPVPN